MLLLALVPVLAAVVLRVDAFFRLHRAAAVLPGWNRRLNYNALYNREAADAQRLLRGAEVPPAERRAVIAQARARAAGLVASLDMAGRFALAMRAAPPPRPPAPAAPGDDPRFDAVPTARDADPPHALVEGCACDLCLATADELGTWADGRSAEAVEHQERAFEVWPAAPPTLPWQRDHAPAEAFCAGAAS